MSTVTRLVLAFPFLALGCNGMGGGSSSHSGTAPPSSSTTTTPPTSSTTTTPVTTATFTGTPSNWLYVADAGNDAITTFKLDSTGTPSAPADTQLTPNPPLPGGGVFHVVSIATDPTGSFLFCSGNQTRAVLINNNLAAVLPIQLASGTLTLGTTATGVSGVSIGVVATGNVIFAVTSASSVTPTGTVTAGSLDPYTYATPGGALTAGASNAFGTNGPPTGAAIDPTATFLYTVNPYDQNIWAFGIDTTGFIVGTPKAPITTPATSQTLTIDSQGQNVYIGQSNGAISSYKIGPPGTLTSGLKNVSVEPAGSTATPNVAAIAIDPTGTYLATANGPSGDVSLVNVNGTLVGAPYLTPNPTTALPASVVWNGGGAIVYVANAGTNTISALQVTSAGLAPLPGSPFALPAGDTVPSSVAVSQ